MGATYVAIGPELSGAISKAITTAIVVLAVVVLYFGRDVLVPFALAILLTFMLSPIVDRFRRWGAPRSGAVVAVVMAAFIVLAATFTLVGSQLVDLAQNLPTYQYTIHEKIRSLRASAPGGDMIGRIVTAVQGVREELSGTAQLASTKSEKPGTPAKEPTPVRIEQPSQPLDVIATALGSLLGPIGTAGIVLVFVVFILLEKDDLRDRFIRLLGRDLNRTTEALNEAASRVSSFLLMQLVINAAYGIPIGIGLYLIGVPNAVLWGFLATTLRFIPYLGPFIAALFPLLLAFAADPGWSMLLWTVALFVCMEIISNNVIEPWLYGASTGLSPVAIIVAAIFWTTLWGPIGLVLATPLTACLVVIGRYVPQLKFLDVALGSEPVLSAEEQFYQRLLSGNVEEGIELAESYIENKPILAFFDEVCLPALRLAEIDRHQGTLATDRHQSVVENAIAIIRDLIADTSKTDATEEQKHADVSKKTAERLSNPVLCVAGRGESDGVVTLMIAHALNDQSIEVRIVPPSAVNAEAIGKLDLTTTEVVFVSYLHPAPQAYARYICKRLRRHGSNFTLVVGCWNLPSNETFAGALATTLGADAVVTSIGDAVRQIVTASRPNDDECMERLATGDRP